MLGTNKGYACYFNLFTFQTVKTINVSACAKAARLLEFKGKTRTELGVQTREFTEYLSQINLQQYTIGQSQLFGLSTAFSSGNFLLVFDKQSTMLSKQMASNLMA